MYDDPDGRVVAIREDGSYRVESDDYDPYDPVSLHDEFMEWLHENEFEPDALTQREQAELASRWASEDVKKLYGSLDTIRPVCNTPRVERDSERREDQ